VKYTLKEKNQNGEQSGVKSNEYKKSTVDFVIKVFKDHKNRYNAIYCFISILTLFNRAFFILLLFDLVTKSKELKNVTLTFYNNAKLWAITLGFGMIICYIFSVIAYN
jgi:formate-dependent nitrite reductase membrane component NrfD